MSTTMGSAFEKMSTDGKSTGKQPSGKATAPKPTLSLDDIKNRLSAILNRSKAEAVSPDDKAALIKDNRELKEAQRTITEQLNLFGAKDATEFASRELVNKMVKELQALLVDTNANLEQLQNANPWLAEENIRVGRICKAAVKIKELFNQMTTTTPAPAVEEAIKQALNAGVIAEFPTEKDSHFSWTFKTGETFSKMFYIAVNNEPEIQQAVGAIIGYLDERNKVRQEAKDLDWEKFSPFIALYNEMESLKLTKTRSIKAFLTGDGATYVLPVEIEGRDQKTDFLGLAVLVRNDSGKIVVTKANNIRLAKKLFGHFKDGQQFLRDKPLVVDATNGVDKLEVRSDLIRSALRDALANEVKYNEAREAAAQLCDLSTIKNPLSYQDLRAGQEGIYPVDILDWEVAGRKHPVRLTFLVEGLADKAGSFQITTMTPGTLEKEPKLADSMKPTPLTELDNGFWRAVLFHNSKMEFNIKVQSSGASITTKDTVNDLVGIQGKDGLYALFSSWFQKDRTTQKSTRSNVYYVIERSGDQLTIVWAAPGTSAKIVNHDREQAKSFTVTDLPKTTKAILRNAYMSICDLHGENGMAQLPENLKPEPRTQAAPSDSPTES